MAVLNLALLQGSVLIWVAASLILVYIPVSYFVNYRKCAHIKGPWLASISSLWLFRTTIRGRLYLDCAAVLDQYGSLARIGPNKIVTNDPDLWRSINAPRSAFTKGTWYDSMALDTTTKNSLAQRDDKEHNKLRAKMIRGYSGRDVPNLEVTIDQTVLDLINLIRSQIATNKIVDIARCVQFFTLDVLTTIAFSARLGYLKKNEDVFQYVQKISEFLSVMEVGSNSPTIQSIMSSKLMAPMKPKITDKSGMGAMLGLVHGIANERFAPGAKPGDDMMGSFIKNGMSQLQVESESMLQVLGGSDSTATGIRMIFLYILTNPYVCAKVVSEIDAAHAKGSLSQPVVRCSESRQSLPYLHACIKEGLRMFPPLAGIQTKVPPKGGATWNGVHIPAGVEICWNPQSMQRRPEIYGPDASMFRPERWIEAEADAAAEGKVEKLSTAIDGDGDADTSTPAGPATAKLNKMNQTLNLIFGHGKYGCLGKTVAWIELDKIFVALFGNFEFALVNSLAPMKTICHGVHVQTELLVRASERKR